MLKKFGCILTVLMLVLCLCGCSLFSAETAELLSPPALTGDMLPISEALKASVSSEYTLEYPSRGNYRSAIVMHDIDRNGILEAFAFYSTTKDNSTFMNINVVNNIDGLWKSVSQEQIAAGGVDRIDFCDLDGDGLEEILVGWEIYGTSERQLAVYSLGETSLFQRMLEQYTHFITCDLDANDHNEVLIIKSSPAENLNTAHLYSITSKGVSQTGYCELDSTAKTLNHPIVATLSTGAPAVYIDEIKGVGAVTEVLFLEKGILKNPLLDLDTKETTQTLRSASFESFDINEDGILEIPVQTEVPTVTKSENSEKLYLTDWCSFNGVTLTSQLTTIINASDGYYFILPAKWRGKISVLKDTQDSTMEIYRYDKKKKVSKERLMYFKTVKKSDWDRGQYKNQDITEILNDGTTSYLCYISAAAEKDGVDIKKVINDFKLY